MGGLTCLGLPFGVGDGAAGGSSVVREGGGTYAVQGGDSELTDELDDIRTPTMRLARLGKGLKADGTGSNALAAAV